jgi:hypothetical protein
MVVVVVVLAEVFVIVVEVEVAVVVEGTTGVVCAVGALVAMVGGLADRVVAHAVAIRVTAMR